MYTRGREDPEGLTSHLKQRPFYLSYYMWECKMDGNKISVENIREMKITVHKWLAKKVSILLVLLCDTVMWVSR